MIPFFNTNYMKLRSSMASYQADPLSNVAFSSDKLITLKGRFLIKFYAMLTIKGPQYRGWGHFYPYSWLGSDGKPLMSGWSYGKIEEFYQDLISQYFLSVYNISMDLGGRADWVSVV